MGNVKFSSLCQFCIGEDQKPCNYKNHKSVKNFTEIKEIEGNTSTPIGKFNSHTVASLLSSE